MDVEINVIAVGLATLSSFVVGFIWYTPKVFGETWRKLIGMDKKTMDKGPAPRAWFLTVIGALLQAVVLAYVTYLTYSVLDTNWMESALLTSILMWLGFQVSLLLTHDSFEQRRLKLTTINAGNQLVTLLIMGLVIGSFTIS